MEPWIFDEADNVLQRLLRPEAGPDIENFRGALRKHRDLWYASEVPETKEDILVSIVLRFLRERVLLCDLSAFSHHVRLIKYAEGALQSHVTPNRDD